ncbi:hypothetical protein ACLB2K_060027 [Fragaria x ananassa]
MEKKERISKYFARSLAIVNQMKANGEDIKELHIVEKILRTLTERFEGKVTSIEESQDLNAMMMLEFNGVLRNLGFWEVCAAAVFGGGSGGLAVVAGG